jgi:hypothetical protein
MFHFGCPYLLASSGLGARTSAAAALESVARHGSGSVRLGDSGRHAAAALVHSLWLCCFAQQALRGSRERPSPCASTRAALLA